MKKILLIILTILFSLNAQALFEVKDASNHSIFKVSDDGLMIFNYPDTLMIINSSEIRVNLDNSTKGLSRSFSVSTSATGKGTLANVLEVGTQSTIMREGGGDHYTDFSPENTFIGLNAGAATDPDLYPDDNYGKRNVFIGYESGRTNIIGYQNVLIGDSTGYNTAATTSTTNNAVRNVCIGTSSGFWNKEGDINTFVGYLSGYSNNKNGGSAVGICNTYIGGSSGRNNIDGTFNCFMGYRSGYKMTSGSANVFIGQRSGENKTGGDGNTMIGANAGASNGVGEGNVFIGRSSGSTVTASDRLYIDNSNTTSPLIYGEFDNNFLEVNGNLHIENTTNVIGAKGLAIDSDGESTDVPLRVRTNTNATGWTDTDTKFVVWGNGSVDIPNLYTTTSANNRKALFVDINGRLCVLAKEDKNLSDNEDINLLKEENKKLRSEIDDLKVKIEEICRIIK